MFGFNRRRREKKRKAKEKALKKQQLEQQRQEDFNKMQNDTGLPSKEETAALNQRVDELSNEETQRAQNAREGFKKEAMSDINTKIEGMSPEARQAMQESANKQIAGQLANYSQMLASKQGSQGIRGGKAQADLNRQALNAQTQVQRDLSEQSYNREMEKLAAYLSSLEGKEAQDILKRQKYMDYLQGEQQKKKAAQGSQYFNKYYGTV